MLAILNTAAGMRNRDGRFWPEVRVSDGVSGAEIFAMGGHEQAVMRAEARRLVHALRSFGVLRRDMLAGEPGARKWIPVIDGVCDEEGGSA